MKLKSPISVHTCSSPLFCENFRSNATTIFSSLTLAHSVREQSYFSKTSFPSFLASIGSEVARMPACSSSSPRRVKPLVVRLAKNSARCHIYRCSDEQKRRPLNVISHRWWFENGASPRKNPMMPLRCSCGIVSYGRDNRSKLARRQLLIYER